jgi:phytoene dehydrogenase-like protein
MTFPAEAPFWIRAVLAWTVLGCVLRVPVSHAFVLQPRSFNGSPAPILGSLLPGAPQARATTEQSLFRRLRRRRPAPPTASDSSDEPQSAIPPRTPATMPATPIVNKMESFPKEVTRLQDKPSGPPTESAAVCVIGGGVSGLTAALTAARAADNSQSVVLLEASETLGGRVQSDVTEDGFVLDRGFAVFIEEYPAAKRLLDYDALQLGKFLPGALVKIRTRTRLAKVADPLRQPEDLLAAIAAPVGSILDKIALLPLIFTARWKSVDALFEERETDTLYALQYRWGLGAGIIERFFRPFLEGIYLAPLDQQSSRMFMFVFKMFSEGAATLPKGGMGAVAHQLVDQAQAAGADVRVNVPVTRIYQNDKGFLVESLDGKTRIQSQSVVVATDGTVAQRIVSQINGFESLDSLPEQPQRQVGCLYYGFTGPAPVEDPILILYGGDDRGSIEAPINNICFPSVVTDGYAPNGSNLCSVTILADAMAYYHEKEDELDAVVRSQLAKFFPEQKENILARWDLKGIYDIENAQPAQLGGPMPANVNGGRDLSTYRGKDLPRGLLVCGDHMATATLNGALESGESAGIAAVKSIA